jgi:hypothetical protein
LDEASYFIGIHHLEGRYICESKQGSRYIELECAYECRRYLKLFWIGRGFLKISKPITKLIEKDKKFEWTPACEASFQELKKRLMTTPILVMPDMEKLFSIYCDVSG